MSFEALPPEHPDYPGSPKWHITFVDLPGYEDAANKVQTTRLIKAVPGWQR
jgi:hypothetical protein